MYLGLNKVVRALDKKDVHLNLLAKNRDNKEYVMLIEVLCHIHIGKEVDNIKLAENPVCA